MLCREALHDDRAYLQIRDGGLSLLVTNRLPIPLKVNLALQFSRGYIGGDEPLALRARIIDEDGQGPEPFGIDFPPIAQSTHAQMAGQGVEQRWAFAFNLANHVVQKQGSYRIDIFANDYRVAYVPFSVQLTDYTPPGETPVLLPMWL